MAKTIVKRGTSEGVFMHTKLTAANGNFVRTQAKKQGVSMRRFLNDLIAVGRANLKAAKKVK